MGDFICGKMEAHGSSMAKPGLHSLGLDLKSIDFFLLVRGVKGHKISHCFPAFL